MNDDTTITQTRVLIVGAGPAGLGISLALKQAGITDQIVVDAREVGAAFRSWPRGMSLLTPSFFSNSFWLTDLNSIEPDTSPADFLHLSTLKVWDTQIIFKQLCLILNFQ